ncbi:MAG: biosynthetic peptidoglycan transglycosylase, partial [Pseudomonadota bacterium]
MAPTRRKKSGPKAKAKPRTTAARRRTPAKRRPKGRRQGPAIRARWEDYRRALGHMGTLATFALIGLGVAFFHYAQDLPDTSALWARDKTASIAILDRHGELLARRGGDPSDYVRLSELPPHVADAVIAVEDRNFRHHIGLNPIAILRAASVNAASGGVVQGGSTITQQLAKNLFLSSDRTVKRKIQELMLALWLEARFDKDEILTLYLNRVYFGAG